MPSDAASRTARWSEAHRRKVVDPAQAVAAIGPGKRVFLGSGAAVPQRLVQALAARAEALYDTEVLHLLTLGADPTTDERFRHRIRHTNFFIGPNVRRAVEECRADYTPIFLSEIPALFKSGALPVDVALISVSPPDRHGFVSYGVSVDIVKSATEAARYVVAEVNPAMPRTLGDSFLHLDEVDAVVLGDAPIPELPPRPLDEIALRIGRYVASLIDDGATLQLGIGSIPDAVLANLGGKADLGVHTEMFSDGVLELVRSGVITNAAKTLHRGKLVTSFVIGSRALYDYVDNNPAIEFRPSQYTNDPFLIAQNDRMVAINSALEVDLTGQVCADSIGHRFFSGIGGQVDFIRGAARSQGGKPIIALPATARGGTVSRIVPHLSEGAGVVTTRGDVHYVVTEYGIASLHGKSIRHRALALISIAHPSFRQELLAAAKAKGYLEGDQIAVTDKKGAYPLELEERIVLRGGQELLVRPIRATDEDLLKELFYSESDRTRYYRFFAHWKHLPRQVLHSLVHIDYRDAMALCAVEERAAAERILGVARYYVNPGTDSAEFALAVHDDWQGQGLGTALLARLIAVARRRGVRTFTAHILADNAPMFELLEGLGIERHSQLEGGVARVEFALPENVAVVPRQAAPVACATGGGRSQCPGRGPG